MSLTTTRRHVLAVALEPFEASALHDALVAQAGAVEVAVVAPALNTRLRHWVLRRGRARAAAAGRLDAWLAALEAAGVRATGWVGDADPMHAIADALAVFPADELLVVTPAEHAPTGSPATSPAARARSSRCPSSTWRSTRRRAGARAPVAFCTFGARPRCPAGGFPDTPRNGHRPRGSSGRPADSGRASETARRPPWVGR